MNELYDVQTFDHRFSFISLKLSREIFVASRRLGTVYREVAEVVCLKAQRCHLQRILSPPGFQQYRSEITTHKHRHLTPNNTK